MPLYMENLHENKSKCAKLFKNRVMNRIIFVLLLVECFSICLTLLFKIINLKLFKIII